MNIELGKLRPAFNTYCRKRRQERGGKVIQAHTAIMELLAKALEGIEPDKLVDLRDLVHRVDNLDRQMVYVIGNLSPKERL